MTCPVKSEFLGIVIECTSDPTVRLSLLCDRGHMWQVDVCDEHDGTTDEPGAVCRHCDETGNGDVHFTVMRREPTP